MVNSGMPIDAFGLASSLFARTGHKQEISRWV
jgi:hypothetical protein